MMLAVTAFVCHAHWLFTGWTWLHKVWLQVCTTESMYVLSCPPVTRYVAAFHSEVMAVLSSFLADLLQKPKLFFG